MEQDERRKLSAWTAAAGKIKAISLVRRGRLTRERKEPQNVSTNEVLLYSSFLTREGEGCPEILRVFLQTRDRDVFFNYRGQFFPFRGRKTQMS